MREQLIDALRAVTAHVMETPHDQLPDWVRAALRRSCLYGDELHYQRLGDAPLFEMTTGGWATPYDLRRQTERFGAVWWTSDRSAKWIPLDEERIALRLTMMEATQLRSPKP
jgi:hypothetical protein